MSVKDGVLKKKKKKNLGALNFFFYTKLKIQNVSLE